MSLAQKIEGSRPSTAAVATRIDMRTLASLARFWASRSEPIRSQSELIRVSLESLLQLLILNNEAESFETQDEAFEYLSRNGLTGGVKFKKSYLKGLRLEGLELLGAGSAQKAAESPEEAEARRQKELAELRSGLAAPPDETA